MLHIDITWWQILIALAFTLSTIDRGLVMLEHLGLLPSQVIGWLQRRWLRRVEEQARRQALDALLANGITARANRIEAELHGTAELLAGHILEAAEDRRMASQDRERLNALYDLFVSKPAAEEGAEA